MGGTWEYPVSDCVRLLFQRHYPNGTVHTLAKERYIEIKNCDYIVIIIDHTCKFYIYLHSVIIWYKSLRL